MIDSLLIVTLFLDLQRRTLNDGMYRTLYQIIHFKTNFNSVLDEESFKEISKDIGKPDN